MAGEKYTNIGKARWENANVGVIKWDPENKAGVASVIDETTGTVYEIGGGGGGGESDFTTAEVTVVNNTGTAIVYMGINCIVEEGDLGENMPAAIAPWVPSISTGNNTVKIPLYKGNYIWQIGDDLLDYEVTVSGDDSEMIGGGVYNISGDNCTITIASPNT